MTNNKRITSREITLMAGELICRMNKMLHCGSDNPETGKINRESFMYLAVIDDMKGPWRGSAEHWAVDDGGDDDAGSEEEGKERCCSLIGHQSPSESDQVSIKKSSSL